jgi:hypothetical protein
VSNKIPTICLMFVSLTGWWSAYVHSQRESDWRDLAIRSVAAAEQCLKSKENNPPAADLYPGSYMMLFTWRKP